MKQQTFKVRVTTSFTDVIEIQAENEEQALAITNQMLFNGEVDVTDNEPDTTCEIEED